MLELMKAFRSVQTHSWERGQPDNVTWGHLMQEESSFLPSSSLLPTGAQGESKSLDAITPPAARLGEHRAAPTDHEHTVHLRQGLGSELGSNLPILFLGSSSVRWEGHDLHLLRMLQELKT